MKAFTSRLKALSHSMSDRMSSDKVEGVQADTFSMYSPADQALMKRWGVTIAQERALLEQLRKEVEAELELPDFTDEYYLRRFLRARKHDVSRAKEMFLDQLEWRTANDVDSVLKDFDFFEREQFFEYYPEGFYCTDRTGRPVYIQQPGKVNTEELWKFTNLDRCVRYHIKQQERYVHEVVPAASLASGQRQEQSIVLVDMDGVGVSTLTGEVRKILALIMDIDQNNYPELMYKTLIINAPATFRILWSMVRHLLDARTQAKIEVLPADYKEALQQYIAPENLMQQYSGTNPTPLLSEPGPWQDAAIQAELVARSGNWAEGLPDCGYVEALAAGHGAEGLAQSLSGLQVNDDSALTEPDDESVDGRFWGAQGEQQMHKQLEDVREEEPVIDWGVHPQAAAEPGSKVGMMSV